MHIGIHCYEYPPCKHGGVGTFTKDLAESLVGKGYKVTVFGFYYDFVLALNQKIEESINGVRVIRLPQFKNFSNNRVNFILSRIVLYRMIKKLHLETPFDLIESPEGSGWLPLGLPCGIPLITRLHGGQAYFGKVLRRKASTLVKWAEKKQLKTSHTIVAVSKYVGVETFKLFNLKKSYVVIYNSVADYLLRLTSTLEIKNSLIVFSGSIIPKKGVEELMDAMNNVMSKSPDAELVLAGKNNMLKGELPYEEYLRSLVKNSYNTRITFLGNIDRETELIPLIQSASACCFPSHAEAFAIAPLEAMALGKAIVNSKLGSGSEAIIDGVSGLLCDPKNPADIAQKILLVLDDPQLASRLGENARKRIHEKFSFNKWVTINIELYKSILAKEN